MFGFSLAKLVVATILILAVWYGFKVVSWPSNGPTAAETSVRRARKQASLTRNRVGKLSQPSATTS